jgi:hypothetical protein
MLREPARNGCGRVALAAFERQTASYNVPSVRMD